jgi:hypothetical protein
MASVRKARVSAVWGARARRMTSFVVIGSWTERNRRKRPLIKDDLASTNGVVRTLVAVQVARD